MSSRFIPITASIKISFIFKAESYFILCIYHILFTYSSIHEYLVLFYLLIIVNNAAMNNDIQKSVQVSAFSSSGYIPCNGIARSYGYSISFSKHLPYCFPQCLYHFTFLPAMHKLSNFSTPSSTVDIVYFFSSPNNSHPNGCDMISPECDVVSHCGLIYIFLRMSYIEHTISLESTKTHGLESQGSTASRPVWAGTLPAQHPCLQHPAGVHLPATPWLSPAEVRGRGDFWCSTDQSPWMQSRVGKWGDDIWKGKWKLFYHSNMLMTTILNPLQNPVQWWDHGRQ